jgi:selenocysteine lyase/cysteine desulfurase
MFFVVDGIQSLGAFPMDVQEYHIDMLSAGSQKWLLSVPGSGFLYCRRELLNHLVPGAYVGASSVVDPMNYLDYNLTPPNSAERFHTGSPNFLGMTALNATLGMLLEIGIERINQRVLHLVDVFIRDMEKRGYQCAASTLPEHRSGIVIVRHPNAEEVCNYMSNEGVIATARGEGVRIAPHFYNTEEELLRVGELLDHFSRA